MLPFLFPCGPRGWPWTLPALSLSLFRDIFHPTVNTVSAHIVHLGHQAAVGCWHRPGDPVTENIMFHGEQQGNTTTNHWKMYVVSTYHAKEWKDCGSDARLSHVQQSSSIPVCNAAVCCLCCFAEWVCYPLGSQLESELHHFIQATDLLCHLKCDREASCPWAAVKCCTASLLQPQAGCSLLAKEKDPLQKCSQQHGWKF